MTSPNLWYEFMCVIVTTTQWHDHLCKPWHTRALKNQKPFFTVSVSSLLYQLDTSTAHDASMSYIIYQMTRWHIKIRLIRSQYVPALVTMCFPPLTTFWLVTQIVAIIGYNQNYCRCLLSHDIGINAQNMSQVESEVLNSVLNGNALFGTFMLIHVNNSKWPYKKEC